MLGPKKLIKGDFIYTIYGVFFLLNCSQPKVCPSKMRSACSFLILKVEFITLLIQLRNHSD